ncbi:4Fe-4S binding protein [Azospirillum halopraeferens]|uniref:4Fe-4S binding protein n=1 Tax=Azospirillum halopraeferens TaxID=34010 RepID=UPI00041102B0|nr:4Fe-4S binding protein [Azospirillum halopraeferens]
MGSSMVGRFSLARDTCTAGLPRLHAERCVHRIAAVATCRACADACPRGAWSVDDGGVSLDAARCDGCGLCVPACPEGVIATPHRPVRRRDAAGPLAMAACGQSGLANGREGVVGVLPCLNAIGLADLIALYGAGVRRLVVTGGDCAACPTGCSTAVRLDTAVAELNRLLDGRGLPPLALRRRSPTPWRAQLRFDTEPDGGPDGAPGIGRRALLRMVAAPPAADPPPAAGRAPARLLPPPAPGRTDDTVPWPWVPSLDAARCTACGACARLCPHGAIRLDPDPPAFHLEPADCTGCCLCTDVCTEDAVILERLAPRRQTTLPLERHRCRACGVEELSPAARPAAADGLCRICRTTRRTARLFQVLD